MGLFDTIHLSPPLPLPDGEDAISEIQTKHFGSAMLSFSVGSVLPESPVLLGVVEEFYWKAPAEKVGEGTRYPVYLAIWHRILAGVYLDFKDAEERLRTVDRLDLIAWLDQAQNDSRRWRRRFNQLFGDLQEWHERKEKPKDSAKPPFHFNRLSDEIVHSTDPLAKILEIHRTPETDYEDDSLFG